MRYTSVGSDLFRNFHQVFELKRDLADDLELGDEVILVGIFSIVDLRAIKVNLEAAFGNRGQRDKGLTNAAPGQFGGEARRLPEVPSGNAVLDLKMGFFFAGHTALLFELLICLRK